MLHNEFSLVVAENTASCETKGRNGKTTNYFLHVFGLLDFAAKIYFVFAEVWQFSKNNGGNTPHFGTFPG